MVEVILVVKLHTNKVVPIYLYATLIKSRVAN